MKRSAVVLGVFSLAICMTSAAFAVGFDFPRGEIPLVEPGFTAFNQDEPQVAFDMDGNAHAVWEDDRSTATFHMFGRSVLSDGGLTPSYRVYQGPEPETHLFPFVFKSDVSSNEMYGFTIDITSSPNILYAAEYDLTTLPSPPAMTDLSGNTLFNPVGVDYFDMIEGMGYVFYVYKENGVDHLYVGGFEQSSNSWMAINQEVTAPMNYRFENPRLAMDDAGYIYLAYDRMQTLPPPGWSLMVRRSVNPLDVGGGFYGERYIEGSFAMTYNPVLAVTGSAPSDLRVAVAYFNDDFVNATVGCTMEMNGDWVGAGTWSGTPVQTLNSFTSTGLNVSGPEMAYDADKNLYVVWTDSRLAYMEFFGNYSLDGGSTFQTSDIRIAAGLQDVVGNFSMATGPNPGDIALAYIRDTGFGNYPNMLYSGAALFDSCDQDPAGTGKWNSWAGITVDSSIYWSDPASYRFD
nr:hypothetical protein [bacterium]